MLYLLFSFLLDLIASSSDTSFLSQSVVEEVVQQQIAPLQDAVRALHIDMIKQFHSNTVGFFVPLGFSFSLNLSCSSLVFFLSFVFFLFGPMRFFSLVGIN
jgi:hypothetical protein